MIHVQKQPEPPHFFEKVQKKGEAFLLQNPHAKGKTLRDYWRIIIPDLYNAYAGICAYTCHKVYFDTGWKTVEHFKPKELYPQDAYRWDNYRFACGALNGRKGIYTDVLDPFTLQDGWFSIQFPSLQLVPGAQLIPAEVDQVQRTIKRLDLNGSTCIQARREHLRPYVLGKYNIEYLEEIAPFLAREIKRQVYNDINHPMWEEYHKQSRI